MLGVNKYSNTKEPKLRLRPDQTYKDIWTLHAAGSKYFATKYKKIRRIMETSPTGHFAY